MATFSRPILLTAVCVLLALSDGCSSPVTSERSVPRPSAATASTASPASVANQYPRPAQDLSSFDPQSEAAKMGIQLYPGATLYSSPYVVRLGNSYTQYGFFKTTDSPIKSRSSMIPSMTEAILLPMKEGTSPL